MYIIHGGIETVDSYTCYMSEDKVFKTFDEAVARLKELYQENIDSLKEDYDADSFDDNFDVSYEVLNGNYAYFDIRDTYAEYRVYYETQEVKFN